MIGRFKGDDCCKHAYPLPWRFRIRLQELLHPIPSSRRRCCLTHFVVDPASCRPFKYHE